MGKFSLPRVILGLRRHDHANLLPGAKKIRDRLAAKPAMCPACDPDLSVLSQQIDDYEKVHLLVIGERVKGAAEAREVKRNILWSSLECERSYVQTLCDADLERAPDYAASAGMRLARRPVHHIDVLAVDLTPVPGTVVLKAAASRLEAPGGGKAKQRLYMWRWTIDRQTFVLAEPTPVAHTAIKDLPLNTEIGFEVAVKDDVGVSEWSQTVTIFVH